MEPLPQGLGEGSYGNRMVSTPSSGLDGQTCHNPLVNSEYDHAVRELGNLTLALRDDLKFQSQSFDGQSFILIEDPLSATFYRVGPAEYAFLSLLDGRTTVAEVLSHLANSASAEPLTSHEAAGLCKWLIEAELASTAESSDPHRRSMVAKKAMCGRFWRNWNPIAMRWPLVNPDPFFTAITPCLRWLFTLWAFGLWAVVILLALYHAAADWPRIVASSSTVVVLGNAWWLTACWVVLKCLHEMAHGIVCKKYGCSVRGAGIILVLFAPIAYVDVTSSWRCRSKWERMHIAAAGIYLELLVAAAALLTWSHTGQGVVNHVCLNIAIMASVTTLLFNANPLMRFDGYYVLADWLEIPNLSARGQQWLAQCARKYLLGINAPPAPWTSGRGLVIRVYALAAFAWRIVVSAGLVMVAATMFHGAGIALAAVALILWIAIPIGRFVAAMARANPWERPSWKRLCGLTALLVGCCALLFLVVPWPGACNAPAVVDYTQPTIVRAGCSGFIREIRVAAGEFVEQDQILAVLENKQLQFELDDLRLNLEKSRLLCRINETRQMLAVAQAERERIAELNKRICEKEGQLSQLTVRAAQRGHIIGRNIEKLVGRYLREGDQILIVGDENRKELQLSIAQDDLAMFALRIGQEVEVCVPGQRTMRAHLTMLEPQAVLQPKHLSLCAANGGPIPVRDKGGEASPHVGESEQYEFLAPRFVGTVALTESQSRQLSSGQLATVSIRPHQETVGMHLFNLLVRKRQRQF